ncbi:ankyrin repeat domain-containing protein [Polaromonas glacialis]|uniref:ankyrin repeat domain-containing protein n=1 Tax=Polaromonas glacialis TaxID=866564 RepID=UPI000691245D|nr:ankyrin repeat domain-containing protein [Polaromonas glacialis]
MRLLTHHQLDTQRVRAQFAKLQQAVARDDFKSPNLKKLSPTPYWRFKLDHTNRLLVQFARHGNENVCLALEVIHNHAYEHSRFLRGASLDWSQLDLDDAPVPGADDLNAHAPALRYIHPERGEIHVLDKVLSFDDAQQAVYDAPAPLILVGSAGSGKTALTLEKLRLARGRVLYVTQSAFLAQSAQAMYFAHGFEAEGQEPEFLSYREFIETLQVPAGRELDFTAFTGWFERYRSAARQATGGLDAHALFEEFRGVISSRADGVLTREAYLALGVRQSLLAAEQRAAVFELFEKYRAWLASAGLFDLNLVAHDWRALAKPTYDFMVVDEVQDLTSVQLALLLRTLAKPGQFLLCGDSNQIVHPNFFSWAAVKTLFWQDESLARSQTISVLRANFRNAQAVTQLANRLLKIKHARFGSIDRETNFLVQATAQTTGSVQLLLDKDSARRELNAKTRGSTQFAVIVLRDEDKAAVRAQFQTPLVFSVHEAKGLEYANVILVDMVSSQRQAFAEIASGVKPQDLEGDTLDYSRARDKTDHSLELFKFYVNALYVALTRAVDQLLLVESDTAHPLLQLLGLRTNDAISLAQQQTSSQQEWAQEARRLELQGKQEQADAIRKNVLKTQKPSWPVWDEAALQDLLPKALQPGQISNKPRQALFDYALWHGQSGWIHELAQASRFEPALRLAQAMDAVSNPYHYDRLDVQEAPKYIVKKIAAVAERQRQPYAGRAFKDVLRQCDQYGVDHRSYFNATPLMMAAQCGNVPLVEALLARGADPLVRDHYGHSAWDHALERFLDDPWHTQHHLDALFPLLSPPVLDVQTAGRLIRLERHQGEYWLLGVMLASYKKLYSQAVPHPHVHRNLKGFCADHLMRQVERVPESVLRPERRRRVYFNGVLSRAEVHSSYQPSRQLWLRTHNGYYVLNPELQLRAHSGAGWVPWKQWLNQPLVHAGCGIVQPGA